MGELRRRPRRQPVLVDVVDRNCAAPFDRMCAAAMLLELHAGAAGAARTRGDVAIRLRELGQEIAGAAGMDAGAPGARASRQSDTAESGGRRRQRAQRRPRRSSASARSPPPPPRRQRRPRPWQGRVALYRAAVAPYETGRKPLLCEQRRQIGEREHGVHAGILLAALTSMARSSAWACGLRTNAASSMSANGDRRRSARHPRAGGDLQAA